jgi:hypothetical protein
MKKIKTIKPAGPLRVCPENPRYFCNAGGKPVFLTGSHTWACFQEWLEDYPKIKFNYSSFLSWMKSHNFNFMRGWVWEHAAWDACTDKKIIVEPTIYLRTGPGRALDGKLKFDVTKFNPEYFSRLRSRIIQAGENGLYVSVMFFQGWSVCEKGRPNANPWKGHPFNISNNVNGVDGDPDNTGCGEAIQTLKLSEITRLQEKYVMHIIDLLNDLDNILYEIVNESNADGVEWQYHMINFIKDYEKKKPKQHSAGMTAPWGPKGRGKNEQLFNSPADWISPNDEGGYFDNPPDTAGKKVIITDTDHLWGHGGSVSWVWKSVCRGLNPVLMDSYMPAPGYDVDSYVLQINSRNHPLWESIRKNFGYARGYMLRMNLKKCIPTETLSSTNYCLAEPGRQYLLYCPENTVRFQINLEEGKKYSMEWLDPRTGKIIRNKKKIKGMKDLPVVNPFSCDAVAFIEAVEGEKV